MSDKKFIFPHLYSFTRLLHQVNYCHLVPALVYVHCGVNISPQFPSLAWGDVTVSTWGEKVLRDSKQNKTLQSISYWNKKADWKKYITEEAKWVFGWKSHSRPHVPLYSCDEREKLKGVGFLWFQRQRARRWPKFIYRTLLIFYMMTKYNKDVLLCYRSRLGLDKEQGMIHLEISVSDGRKWLDNEAV